METQYLSTQDILVDDSRFSIKGLLFEPYNAPTCHITSFDTLGILYPVIVFTDNKKRYHLVDGRKRVQFAKELKEPRIRASLLPVSTPVSDIITLIFCNRRNEIESSIINKVQFLCFAMTLNAPEPWIMNSLCVPFEFKPHSSFLRECERINNLPGELKLFCHEKRISYKQLLNLTLCPEDLLLKIIRWKPFLQLTAATLDELASNLRDYLRRENKKLTDFIAADNVQELLDSSLSPREKTERLRQLVYLRRFPILSEKNKLIQETVESLRLPRGVHISWDRTLENKNVHVSADVTDPARWQQVLSGLSSEEVRKAVEAILDEL